jgi:putative inorganic carbon (hco3(-)) transporter
VFLTAVFLIFIGLGLYAPFVFTVGYAWVDTFRPQDIAFVILNQAPVAMIMGVGALIGYFTMIGGRRRR